MSKNYQRYSEEFKLSVIRDYYSSGMSKYACRRKYHLRSGGTLLNWLRKYENEKKVVSLHPESALARDVMIDKAEEYFDISIRKKSGAKQP